MKIISYGRNISNISVEQLIDSPLGNIDFLIDTLNFSFYIINTVFLYLIFFQI
jgi:hypothetical protein